MFISEAVAQSQIQSPAPAANAVTPEPVAPPISGTQSVQAPVPAAAANAPDPVMANVLLIGMLFMIFYMLVWRPQQQRMKTHKQMMDNLRRGDVVVTAGGLIATVSKIVADDEVELQLADGVKVRAVKNTITSVLVPNGEKGAKKPGAEKDALERAESADAAPAKGKKSRAKKDISAESKISPKVNKPDGSKAEAKTGPSLNVVPMTAPAVTSDVAPDSEQDKTAING